MSAPFLAPLALVLLMLCPLHMAQAAEVCPAHLSEGGKFHMLDGMRLTDGPGYGATDVVPETTGKSATWDIAAMRAAGAEPQVVCAFKHTARTQRAPVPDGASRCSVDRHYPVQALCE